MANVATLGFHRGFGLSVTLSRIVGAQPAAEPLCNGRRSPGDEALRPGLAGRLAEPGRVREAALTLTRAIAASAPLAVASIRATLRAGLADAVGQALERELTEQARLGATEDCAEGVAAARERREPTFRGR
ncbi:enoyl-CoA hydratase/isomerase family protein [Prauserella flavalba]|uniref:Enoyl-CoA hydratase/isomerase n=1 Tax=Prauserella flavalba TaxID=1477506 RepID=A0A318LAH2_9PSEU|nr:enoyl-CoA hydratase-related protein [Prauserella flavalba]PXY18718.1 hypothetical protein BA062_34495 [Prauserella flavalba]